MHRKESVSSCEAATSYHAAALEGAASMVHSQSQSSVLYILSFLSIPVDLQALSSQLRHFQANTALLIRSDVRHAANARAQSRFQEEYAGISQQ